MQVYLDIANKVWEGMTVPEACKSLGVDFHQHWGSSSCGQGRYLAALASLVRVREQFLCSPAIHSDSCGRAEEMCKHLDCPAIEGDSAFS